MKSKLLFSFFIVIYSISVCTGQGWYTNMEKYWYYRYRLVNDFLIVGTDCGNSIPASDRYRDISLPNGNTMVWDDATQHLGHYIATLAVEYKLLKMNSWSTKRTVEELFDAIDAFDRLDRDAEGYMSDIDHRFPCNPGSWSTPYTTNWNNGVSGSFNGFFIRDDVPFQPGPNKGIDNYVINNSSHFNRPGIASSYIEQFVGDCAFSGKTTIEQPVDWPTGAPHWPLQGNQDQMVELFTGMGLVVKLVDDNVVYNAQNIRHKAMDAAARMTSWIPKFPLQFFPEESYYDLFLNACPSNWLMKDPLNLRCVYRPIHPYGSPGSHCSDGGGIMFVTARGIAKAMQKVCANNDPQYIPKAAGMMFSSAFFPLPQLYQGMQVLNQDVQGNVMFGDIWASFAGNWVDPYLGFPNTTWHSIKRHSLQQHWSTPHMPLIYRVNFYPPGAGTGYCPECTLPHIAYMPYSYPMLLDAAPKCGPYWDNIEGVHGDWTGQDRLGHFMQRQQTWNDNASPMAAVDFNGIDYMELFNLYTYTKGNYLQYLINPYYMENFDVTYPDVYNGNIGSDTHKLTLNWLEYLSAKDHITSDGNVTFRGAKVIDLIPGFKSDYGSVFLAYIQDYNCRGNSGDDYHFALDNNVPTEYNVAHMADFLPRPVDTTDIINEDDSLGETIDSNLLVQSIRTNLETTLKNVEDPEIVDYMSQLFGINRNGTWNRNNVFNIDSTRIDYNKWVEIYPNPTNTTCYLEYQLFDPAKIVIHLTNSVGENFSRLIDYYETDTSQPGKYTITIHSEQLTAGVYYCQVAIGDQIVTKKLTVY